VFAALARSEPTVTMTFAWHEVDWVVAPLGVGPAAHDCTDD
jgi:hypothetical protein